MEITVNCPKCKKTIKKKQIAAQLRDLFLGVLLILIGIFFIVWYLIALNDPVLGRSKIHNLLIVSVLTIPPGLRFLFKYLALIKTTIIDCTCDACGFKWKQSAPADDANDQDSLALIRQCLNVSNKHVKLETAVTLGKLRDTESLNVLIDMLMEKSDMEQEDKIKIAKAIGKMGGPAVDPLIDKLNRTPDEKVIKNIVQAMVRTKDERVFDPLIRKSEFVKNKKFIFESLGEAGYKRAIPYILDNFGVNSRRILKQLTGMDFKNDWAKWTEWWEDNKEQ